MWGLHAWLAEPATAILPHPQCLPYPLLPPILPTPFGTLLFLLGPLLPLYTFCQTGQPAARYATCQRFFLDNARNALRAQHNLVDGLPAASPATTPPDFAATREPLPRLPSRWGLCRTRAGTIPACHCTAYYLYSCSTTNITPCLPRYALTAFSSWVASGCAIPNAGGSQRCNLAIPPPFTAAPMWTLPGALPPLLTYARAAHFPPDRHTPSYGRCVGTCHTPRTLQNTLPWFP